MDLAVKWNWVPILFSFYLKGRSVVFRPVYLTAVVMLSVLTVMPPTVGLAKDSHQKSSKHRRSSNVDNKSRAANVRNKSRTPSSSKKLSKSSKNLSKANRSSRKVQSTPARKVPTTKRAAKIPATKQTSKVRPSKRAAKTSDTQRAAKVRPSKRAEKISDTQRAAKVRPSKRAAKTSDTQRAAKVRPSKRAEKTSDTQRAAKVRPSKRAEKIPDTERSSKVRPSKRAAKTSDTQRAAKVPSVTIPPSTKPDRRKHRRPDVLGNVPPSTKPDRRKHHRPDVLGNVPPSTKPDRRKHHRPDVLGNVPPSIEPDSLKPNRPGKNGKRRGTNKLEGIRNFDHWVNRSGEGKLKSIEVEKFHGKFGNVRNSANMKLKIPQARHAKNFAIRKLSLHSRCHWWIDFVIGGHWHRNHCHWWDYCDTPDYWRCWTPCRYQVVSCPPVDGYVSSSWYFGIDCILVPDMAAYGIQEVKPNSPAAYAGLREGDLIVSINGQGIEDELVLPYAIQTSGGRLELGVIREGSDEPVLVYVALQQIERLSY